MEDPPCALGEQVTTPAPTPRQIVATTPIGRHLNTEPDMQRPYYAPAVRCSTVVIEHFKMACAALSLDPTAVFERRMHRHPRDVSERERIYVWMRRHDLPGGKPPSWPEIGACFLTSHSTIITAVQRFERRNPVAASSRLSSPILPSRGVVSTVDSPTERAA